MTNKRLLRVLLIGCALGAVLSGQTLFVGSGDSNSSFVFGMRSDPLSSPSSLVAAPNFFQALPAGSPIATQYWLLSKNSAGTITVVDSSLASVVRSFNLGSAPVAATISPDARRILILTDRLRIFDAVSGTEMTFVGDVGVNPSDLAVSWDSRRAYVLSGASQRLTTVDLNSNSVTGGNVSVPAGSTAVSVSPTGLIYVSASQALYEYYHDYFSTSPVFRTQFAGVVGVPGKLSFSPDGTRGATVDAYSNIYVYDLVNHNAVGQTSLPTGASKVVLPDNSRMVVYSSGGQRIYQAYLSYISNISEASFGSVGYFTNVRDIAISNESPSARFLYVTAGSLVQRIDLNSGTLSGQVVTATVPGNISLPPTGNPGLQPFYLLTYNGSQTVALNAQPLPLIVRVTDVSGRPLAGVRLTYSSTSTGVTVVSPSVVTGLDGLAGTAVLVGSIAGQYVVNASIDGTSIATSFSVTTSGSTTGGGGTGTSGGLQVWAGTGQVVAPKGRTGTNTAESLIVRVVDASGNPLANQTVSWTMASDPGILGDSLETYTSTTDQDGFASTNYVAGIVQYTGFGQPIARSVITASTGYQVVSFTTLTLGNLQQVGINMPGTGPGFMTATRLQPASGVISGKVGQTLTGAVQVRAVANGSYQFPGVGVRVFDQSDNTINSFCNGGYVFTDSSGTASCDVVVRGQIGTRTLTIRTGSQFDYAITLNVLPGDASTFGNVSGDNQSGKPGTRLPVALSAVVTDASGNPIPGAAVIWSVPVAGTVTLTNQSSVSDAQGRVSAVATLGSTPGTAQVILTAGGATYMFTLTTQVTIGAFAYVSGDAQFATVGNAFAQPLVVKITDAQGKALSGLSVNFAVTSGVATLSSATATTDANGNASITVTAGSTAGGIVVQATTTGQTPINFNLTARIPGPVFSAAQIVNAASFQAGVSPGALVTIYASGIAAGMNGAVLGNPLGFGPLPLKLAGVEVSFGGSAAPIYSVSNVGGQESVTVQVPYEVNAGTTSVTVKINGVATTVDNVAVKRLTPGIFEMTDAQSRRYAIIVKSDGSFVSPDNPAVRGENLTLYVSGLGAVTPATFTNRLGTGNQNVAAPIVVGVNNAGNSGAYTATLSPTLIGVYQITFQLDANAAAGTNVPLSISAQDVDGTRIFSNSTSIAAVR
jgi:uncharacterized protein (TIGR03437 family)